MHYAQRQKKQTLDRIYRMVQEQGGINNVDEKALIYSIEWVFGASRDTAKRYLETIKNLYQEETES